MQKDDSVNGLSREASWRGELTPDQVQQLESWLAAHPEERGVWEEEVALTRLLTQLPDAAAPSNLTVRIMDAIEERVPVTRQTFGTACLGWLRKLGWVPRLAGVALLVVAGYVGHHQYRTSNQRAELARNVAEVSELVTAVPSVEVLQDFTAIRNLETTVAPDKELLAFLE